MQTNLGGRTSERPVRYPGTRSGPRFAFEGRRLEVRDPRDFTDYRQWRDSLQVGLFSPACKLKFYTAYFIDREIPKSAISREPLASGHEYSAHENERSCVNIYCCSGADPPLDYDDLLGMVEKGQATQTVACLCEPLKREYRRYPWETILFISDTQGSQIHGRERERILKPS